MKFIISLDHNFYNISMTVGARKGMTSSPAEIWEDPQPKLLPDLGQTGEVMVRSRRSRGSRGVAGRSNLWIKSWMCENAGHRQALSPENRN